MFDFGNMEEQQKELQKKLDGVIIDHASDDGKIKIKINANRKLVDLSIDPSLISEGDTERLEDLLLIEFNRAVELAEVKAEAEMRKQIDDILPGGLGSLLGG